MTTPHEHDTLAEQPPSVEPTPTDVVAMLRQQVNELQFKWGESQRQVEELRGLLVDLWDYCQSQDYFILLSIRERVRAALAASEEKL